MIYKVKIQKNPKSNNKMFTERTERTRITSRTISMRCGRILLLFEGPDQITSASPGAVFRGNPGGATTESIYTRHEFPFPFTSFHSLTLYDLLQIVSLSTDSIAKLGLPVLHRQSRQSQLSPTPSGYYCT